MRRTRAWLFAIALLLVPVVGAGAAPAATVGISISTLNNPFFVELRDGAQNAARAANVQLAVVDAQNDPAKQASDIDDLIQRRVRVIIINPTDSDAIVPTVRRINAANIPVVTVDRAANGGTVRAHIASDNVLGGRLAAEYIARRLNNRGNVVMLEGIAGTSAARDRGRGFREGLQKFPNLKLVATQTADFDRAKGLSVMENVLQAQRQISAVFAQNDEMALGAIQAIRAAGRQNIVVVGFDAIPDALRAIQQGTMAATVAQQPGLMGRLSVETAAKIIQGQQVATFTPVPVRLVTKQQ